MVGEISNWSRGRTARAYDWRLHAAWLAAIVGVFAYILFVPDQEDLKLLPFVSGCYLNYQHRVAIIVDRRKLLRGEGMAVPVKVYAGKSGALLLPTRRVFYDRDSNRLETAVKDPAYVASDRFFGELTVQTDNGAEHVIFERVRCPAAAN